MIINTTTKETIEKGLAKYFDITVEEIYSHIKYAAEKTKENNQNVFNSEYFDEIIISDLRPKDYLDYIMLFHLSRRLCGDESNVSGMNLIQILTGPTNISSFLREKGISFADKDGRIVLFVDGKEDTFDNGENSEKHTSVDYLRKRFGYCNVKDFCFNGFALGDQLLKNQYAKLLSPCPEIIERIDKYIPHRNVKNNYKTQSDYWCFQYLVPLKDITIDGYDRQDEKAKEHFIIARMCERLYEYMGGSKYLNDDHNVILRVDDNKELSMNYYVEKYRITPEMISEGQNIFL